MSDMVLCLHVRFFFLLTHTPASSCIFFWNFLFLFSCFLPEVQETGYFQTFKNKIKQSLRKKKEFIFFSFMAEVHKTGLLPDLWPLKTWL